MRHRWWGFVAGLGIGAFDWLSFALLDVQVSLQGTDARGVVLGFYAVTFAGFGYALGRLSEARAQIRAQLAELEASRAVAIQNEKLAALGRLAAGVAHEVRNPLGVIKSSAALVQEGLPEGDDRRALGFIVEETDRLDQMITALLAFSRPAKLDKKPARTDEIVDRAILLAADRLSACAIERPRQTHEVYADADLVVRALLDLFVNAAEAGADRLAIDAAGDGAGILIEVRDSGPGLAPEDCDKVFEPFFTTKTTGTGLGLPMAKKIAQAHGGDLLAVPGHGAGEGGRGACFRLTLPREAR